MNNDRLNQIKAEVNKALVALGEETLSDLPEGLKQDCYNCPVSRSLYPYVTSAAPSRFLFHSPDDAAKLTIWTRGNDRDASAEIRR